MTNEKPKCDYGTPLRASQKTHDILTKIVSRLGGSKKYHADRLVALYHKQYEERT